MRVARLAPLFGALAVLAVPRPAAAEACADPVIHAEFLTPADATLPEGGAVIAWLDEPTRSPWLGKGTEIAPSLYAFAMTAKGDFAIETTGHKPALKVHHGAPAKVAGAPVLKSIIRSTGSNRRGRFVAVSATTDTAPKGVLAMVLFAGGHPRSWSRVYEQPNGVTAVSLYAEGTCTSMPNGTVPTFAGDKVQVAWVDASGRLSALSEVVTVVPRAEPSGPRRPSAR